MKIALCRPHNLAPLIDLVYGQELACLGRLGDLKRIAEVEPADSRAWPRLMRVLARDAEVAFWNARIEWLQSARELLERMSEESRRVPLLGGPTVDGSDRIGHRLRAL